MMDDREKRLFPEVLEWMRDKGSSLLLNWGEDDGLWECSWISGGRRYPGFSKQSPLTAMIDALTKARAREACGHDLGTKL